MFCSLSCSQLSPPLGAGAWTLFFRPINVQVSHVERDVPVQVFGLGTVEARVTSKVGFKVSGVLVDLRADVGDRVAKGAVLARLDDREQRARVARAKAAIEQAEANLQRATASVEKAKANYANAKSINERRQKLVQSNTTSVETAETAKAAQDAALADVNLAKSDIAGGAAAISDAKAQQQQEAATLDFHTLTAPYDAMVTARQKELGSALARRRAGLHADRSADRSGCSPISTRAKPAKSTSASRPRSFCDPFPASGFRGGLPGSSPKAIASTKSAGSRSRSIAYRTTSISANRPRSTSRRSGSPQALLVPEAAIEGLGKNRGTVWTVEDGRLQQREVTLGHRLLDGRYEITGGLPDKAVVVTQLRSGLRVGRAAKITEGPSR